MAIDNDPIFTLDILGSEDTDASNLMLRQNKTKMIVRGSRDYLTTYRNNILKNRGYGELERHQQNWNIKEKNYWTPLDLPTQAYNLESWILPEYFNPRDTDPDYCIWANNRVGYDATDDDIGDGGFKQDNANAQPLLAPVGPFRRNFKCLTFANDFMEGTANDMWDVNTKGFMCFIVFQSGGGGQTPIVTKKTGWQFLLEVDHTSTGTADGSLVFTMNNVELTLSGIRMGGTGANEDYNLVIAGFGRSDIDDTTFLQVFSEAVDVSGPADDTDLDTVASPRLGRQGLSYGNHSIYEIIFVNTHLGTPSGQTQITTENKDLIEGYLAWKYNVQNFLHAGHPYIDAPPLKLL